MFGKKAKKIKKTKAEYKQRYMPIEKIAKIKTADLPIQHREGEPAEHFVYVREYDRKRQVYTVNICTHLERKDKKTGKYINDNKNIQQVKYGNTYPIPIDQANFSVWTGIKKDTYEVSKGKMYSWNCVRFKRRHRRDKNDSFYTPR